MIAEPHEKDSCESRVKEKRKKEGERERESEKELTCFSDNVVDIKYRGTTN